MSGQSMPPYQNYKDSGVFWLGDIPESWSCRQLKYVAGLSTEKVVPSGVARYVGMENVRSNDGGFVITTEQEPEGQSLSFKDGDVLFGKLRPYLAKSWLASFSGICSSEFLVLGARKVSPRYLNYTTLSREFISVVDSSTYGAKMPRASWDFIGMLKVPVPDFSTSVQIAKFLDYETAKIDALIEKQQQLIALLKEKRQAVISHAVTKGLNPDAPLRDSGVEWLGEVPAHWEVTRLKYTKSKQHNAFVDGPFGSNLKSEHFLDDGTVFVIESGFATSGELQETKLKRISENHFATIIRSEARKGDIIIAKIGARYGMSSILPMLSSKAVVSGNSLKLTVDAETMDVDYAHALLGFLKVCGAMDDNVNVTAQPALSLGGLNNILFLRPPFNEQASIVRELETQLEWLDDLIAVALSLAETLVERRTALISAAVTGKIDVRGWKAPESKTEKETA